MTKSGGVLVCGPYDALVVLHSKLTGRYHPAILVEAPLSDDPAEALTLVRLRLKFYHSQGMASWPVALEFCMQLAGQFGIPPANVVEGPMPWDGEWSLVVQVGNWVTAGVNVNEAIAHRS